MGRNEIFKLGIEDFGELLNTVLSPANAIKVPELLQGRDKQLLELRQALTARGRHVFIHGFRGVGKTSLGYSAIGQDGLPPIGTSRSARIAPKATRGNSSRSS